MGIEKMVFPGRDLRFQKVSLVKGRRITTGLSIG
jgi:hypothetical protein